MASSSSKPIYEGVFAINKPTSISSAQVIRDAQQHFRSSALFKPLIDRDQANRDAESHNQKRKRKWKPWKQKQDVKMGHGGTLDPMATGVLILGVGNGTKSLNSFTTQCSKSYETVVLFGAATDSYDSASEAKVVARRPHEHITKEIVEEALRKFRGKIMQRPPVFSALRVRGKRLYEYAREGKEVPVEIEKRPVEVENLEMMEWMDGRSHEFHWPTMEATAEEKRYAEKMLRNEPTANGGMIHNVALAEDVEVDQVEAEDAAPDDIHAEEPPSTKRKRGAEDADLGVDGAEPGPAERAPSPKRPKSSSEDSVNNKTSTTAAPELSSAAEPNSGSPCPAPAVRLRMTVTSGFYVRSLANDLGAGVGSYGLMASLVRTRQGEFELGKNVLEYDDLEKGEEVWSEKLKGMLETWAAKTPEQDGADR